MECVFVTGAAGFIGYYLSKRLLEQGYNVVGIDNLNDYYDVRLKYARLNLLKPFGQFSFVKGDISDKEFIDTVFKENVPAIVVNLAAQAGVRYSIENPDAYIKSNIVGFFNILEACRRYVPKHLVYASSSSVYGNNQVPFKETDFVDHPSSFYAATKKSNELMAYTYSHLYKIPATGLRFFTVYGPMGRPDMAYYTFTDKYFKGEPVHIFNNGDFKNDLYRDFTYIDDIVDGIMNIIPLVPKGEAPHTVYNIGNNRPETLMNFIKTLEKAIGRALDRDVQFKKVYEPLKPGDVPATYACIDAIKNAAGFEPKTDIQEGLQKFIDWYVDYYNLKTQIP
jgi:Nucleoside-diphosphate-sugar epimerases